LTSYFVTSWISHSRRNFKLGACAYCYLLSPDAAAIGGFVTFNCDWFLPSEPYHPHPIPPNWGEGPKTQSRHHLPPQRKLLFPNWHTKH